MDAHDPPLCLVADDVDVGPLRACTEWRVRTIASLDAMLAQLREWAPRGPQGTRSLDLIGHSTRDHHFLRFGETGIDMTRPAVARVFDTVKSENLLPQLGVAAVRLLGCSTAATPSGQRSMRRLARTLGLPVYGSIKMLMAVHYTADGFNPKFAQVLIESSQLPSPPRRL